jgi:hypothetical protein
MKPEFIFVSIHPTYFIYLLMYKSFSMFSNNITGTQNKKLEFDQGKKPF